MAPGATLASGDCKPNHTTNTNVYVCRYTVGSSDNGAFAVKAGTSSVDKANNALASAYTHAAALTLDTGNPGIAFPTAGPRVGSASEITLTDAASKVRRYGAIAVAGTETDATACNTSSKIGSANLTTLATPALQATLRYTPPSGSAGKQVCVWAEDVAGNSHAALWTTAIVAATTPPAGAILVRHADRGCCRELARLWLRRLVGHLRERPLRRRLHLWRRHLHRLHFEREFRQQLSHHGFQRLTGNQVKSALGALTLTVDGTALAVIAVTASTSTPLLLDVRRGQIMDRRPDGFAVADRTRAAPAAPTGLTAAKDGAVAIDLSWTAPATASTRAAVTGYEIEWSADGSTGWTDLTTISTASTTTYKDSGLAASTTRPHRVRATSSAGAGAWSSTASATTDAAASRTPRHHHRVPDRRAAHGRHLHHHAEGPDDEESRITAPSRSPNRDGWRAPATTRTRSSIKPGSMVRPSPQ